MDLALYIDVWMEVRTATKSRYGSLRPQRNRGMEVRMDVVVWKLDESSQCIGYAVIDGSNPTQGNCFMKL